MYKQTYILNSFWVGISQLTDQVNSIHALMYTIVVGRDLKDLQYM